MPANIEPPKPVRPHAPIVVVAGLSTWQKIKLALKLKAIYNNTLGNMNITSWKSKVAGLLIALAPLVMNNVPAQWHWVGEAMVTLAGLLVMGGRDNNVSSQDVGIR